MTDREALKLALEALEINLPIAYAKNGRGERFPCFSDDPLREIKTREAITALRQALKQPEQEPVAFVCRGKLSTIGHCEECKPLYTAPPKREWVELTGDEVNDLKHWLDHRAQWSYIEFARAIEAKLKEKNRE